MSSFIQRFFAVPGTAALLAAAFCLNASATDLDVPDGPVGDADCLLYLGLMRGHLMVGHELFNQGEHDAAQTHSKHPGDELYAVLLKSFEERGARGFADELSAHAAAVESGGAEQVRAAYADVMDAIHRHEQSVTATPALVAEVVVGLLRVAADEYAIGIVDGRLENAHEYQDAYGFTRVALEWAGQVDRAAFGRVTERLLAIDDMWPALVPPNRVPQSASRLYGTAAEVEILTLRLAGR